MDEEAREVSYDYLLDLLRTERRGNRPVPLRDGFWKELREYMSVIETEFRAAYEDDPLGRKAVLLMEQFKHSREAIQGLWALRERKILQLATAFAASKSDPEGLTSNERALFANIRKELAEGRQRVLYPDGSTAPTKPVEVPKPKETPKPVEIPKPVVRPAEVPVAEPAEKIEVRVRVPADTPDQHMVLIKAIANIPTFVGPDLEAYSLKVGDYAEVPSRIAEMMVKRNKAEVIRDRV